MCRDNIIVTRLTKVVVRGTEIEFPEKIALNPETNEEIFIRELEIENDIRLYDYYKKEKGLLQSHEIKRIREKYNLNQKDFSRILGFGDVTIHRYENGTIQTEANDAIIRLATNPFNMEKMMYRNTDKVSPEVIKHLATIINQLKIYQKHRIAQFNKDDINRLGFNTKHVTYVAETIINTYNQFVDKQNEQFNADISKITNLELQKLLYYVQGICLTVYNKPAFNENILAWSYGPVVYEIYNKYKQYSNKEIPWNKSNNKISKGLEKVIEIVVEYYGRFSASQLIRLTHQEDPWIQTKRNGVIEQPVIKKYFDTIYSNNKWESDDYIE